MVFIKNIQSLKFYKPWTWPTKNLLDYRYSTKLTLRCVKMWVLLCICGNYVTHCSSTLYDSFWYSPTHILSQIILFDSTHIFLAWKQEVDFLWQNYPFLLNLAHYEVFTIVLGLFATEKDSTKPPSVVFALSDLALC